MSGEEKILNRLRRMLTERRLDRVLIAVDGGIGAKTAGAVTRAGATVLVAGSAIFNDRATVAENLRQLRSAIERSPGRTGRGKGRQRQGRFWKKMR